MSTASHTCGSSSSSARCRCGRRPRAPCAITASTPQPATFSAWRRAPTVGITTTPASFSSFTSRSPGAWAKLATFTPSRTSSAMRSSTSGWSERRFTPNGLSVRLLHLVDRLGQLVEGHRGAGQDAEPAGRARRRREARPRDPTHPGLHDRELDPEELARRACAAPRASRVRDFLLAQAVSGRGPRGSARLLGRRRARSRARRRGRRARSRSPRRSRRRSRPGAPSGAASCGRASRSRGRRGW